MKRIKFINSIALLGLLALGATSCEDWLTIYPQDKVVEEDFWEDRNDLDGVRYRAYTNMAGTLTKFVLWGDLRSDSYTQNNGLTGGLSTRDTYKKIIEAKPDTTMDIFDWGSVYTTINTCNKVLEKGEVVLANDAQFTRTEWNEMKAEMVALRAFNYFYLLRAFKDIPYTTTTVSSDQDVKIFSYTSQMDVLDSLIEDLESVKGRAKNRFSKKADTKGLMTNTAIYALMADIYLWRSAMREGRNPDSTWWRDDAEKVIEYSQKSIDALAYQEKQAQSNYGEERGNEYEDYGLSQNYGINNCNLIANPELTNHYNNKREQISVPSYSAIFGGSDDGSTGNSSESIFELQFSNSDKRSTGVFTSIWGYNNSSAQLLVSGNAIKQIYESESKMNMDSRTWYSANKYVKQLTTDLDEPACMKYLNCNFQYANNRITANPNPNTYAHWIFYRLTDVMLMQAEAYAVLGGKDNFNKCKAIVDAIHKRSTVGEEAAKSAGTDRNGYIKLVMNERQIELLGEGKRWFDLVRWAERRGGGINPDPREPQYMDGAQGVQDMVKEFLISTHSDLESTLKNRIKNRYGLYCPIFYKELQASNYQIEQNPVWNREK